MQARMRRLNSMWTVIVKTAAFALLIGIAALNSAEAANSKFYASLGRLDPRTRLEQICDLEAMLRIHRDGSSARPDRAKSDVISPPRHAGDVLNAPGAAFRDRGRWYKLAFVCKASPDHLQVQSFTYKVGELIPASKWADYGLWR